MNHWYIKVNENGRFMITRFKLSPLNGTDFPACTFKKCVFSGQSGQLKMRSGGSIDVINILSILEIDGEYENGFVAFHFRLSNGMDNLRLKGSSYGSLLCKLPHVEDPIFFDDYYSKCFAEISIADY